VELTVLGLATDCQCFHSSSFVDLCVLLQWSSS
jgi:hypothetical protein